MKKIKDLQIRTWVLFFLLSLTAINFFSIGGYVFFNNIQSKQQAELASQNNALALEIAGLANRLQHAEATVSAASMYALFGQYEAGLQVLEEEEAEQEIFIDKALKQEREKLIERAKREWLAFKQDILSRFNKQSAGITPVAVATDNALPTAFLLVNSALVKAFHDDSVDGTWFHSILVVSSILSFLVLLGSYVILHRLLFDPLKEIGVKARQMAAGDYDQAIAYAYRNELAEFTGSLNQLFSKFRNTAFLVKELGKGNLDFRLDEVCSTEDFQQDIFVKSLLETRDTLKKNAQANEERSWATAGIAKLEDILRQHNKDLNQLSDAVLVFLVKYLKANQGAVFLLSEEEEQEAVLEMTGCYAYGRKKYLEKTVKAGEGLVGQILLEKEMLYLTDLPKNYTTITSGLGEATPSALLVFPLKVEEQVIGVIELAAFIDFAEYQREFVAQAAQSIASSVMNARINIRTSRLLEKSQQQTEELRAAEEEMRQNMEEMEATQEEMERIRQELEGQQGKLSEAMSIAHMANWEIDLQSNEFLLNDNFFELLGTSAAQEGGYQLKVSQIVKQYFYPEADKVQAAIERVVAAGSLQHEEKLLHKAVNKAGEGIFLLVVLKALLSEDGRVRGLYGVCRDVTHERLLEQERDNQLEEMQAQEEELRQNMEEMQATQEEMRRVSIELEEQREKLADAMRIAKMANWEIELASEEFSINDNFYQLLGTTAQEEGGYRVKVSQIVSKYFYLDAERVQQAIGAVVAKADPKHEEFLVHKALTKAGEEIYLSVVLKAVLSEEGKVSGLYGVCRDVTNERLLEQQRDAQLDAMQETQQELDKKLQENMNIQRSMDAYLKTLGSAALLSEADQFGNIIDVNEKFCEVTKYSREEVIGKPHNILRHPDNPKSLFKEMWATIKAGKTFKGRFPNKAKDGSTYWVESTIEPVYDAAGKLEKYIGIRFDITDQVKKEKEIERLLKETQDNLDSLQATEEELRQNMEEIEATQEELHRREQEAQRLKLELDARVSALDEAALMTESDLHGNITYVNAKFCEVAKYSPEEAIGKPHNILRHPDTPKAVFKEMWQTIKKGKVFKGRYPNKAKDGSTYWVDATIVPVLGEDGKPEKYIGIRFDITEEMERKKKEELQREE